MSKSFELDCSSQQSLLRSFSFIHPQRTRQQKSERSRMNTRSRTRGAKNSAIGSKQQHRKSCTASTVPQQLLPTEENERRLREVVGLLAQLIEERFPELTRAGKRQKHRSKSQKPRSKLQPRKIKRYIPPENDEETEDEEESERKPAVVVKVEPAPDSILKGTSAAFSHVLSYASFRGKTRTQPEGASSSESREEVPSSETRGDCGGERCAGERAQACCCSESRARPL